MVKYTIVKVLTVMAQVKTLKDQERVEFERAGHRKVIQNSNLVCYGRHFFPDWFLTVYHVYRESVRRFIEEFIYIVHKSQEHCNPVLCMGLRKNTS